MSKPTRTMNMCEDAITDSREDYSDDQSMHSTLKNVQKYIHELQDIFESENIDEILDDFLIFLDTEKIGEIILTHIKEKFRRYVVKKDSITEDMISRFCNKMTNTYKTKAPAKIGAVQELRQKRLNEFTTRCYKNQIESAKNIVEKYEKDCRVFMVKGQVQSGKTGVMSEIVRQFIEKDIFAPDNFRIMTGINSVAWEKQTKERFPKYLKKYINALKNFSKVTSDGMDICYIVDEAQIATKHNQTMSKFFETNGNVLSRNKKSCVIFVSATPDDIGNDIIKIGSVDHSCEVEELIPGESYIGLRDLYNQKRICEIPEISSIEEIDIDFLENYFEIYTTEPKYHFFRCPVRGKSPINYNLVLYELRNIPGYGNDFWVKEYIQNGNITEEELKNEPDIHTIILIKDKLTCAQTICKIHLGNMLDRASSNETWTVQSLCGRACGYDDNGKTKIYCSLVQVLNYIKNDGWKHDRRKKNISNTIMKTEMDKISEFRIEFKPKSDVLKFSSEDEAVKYLSDYGYNMSKRTHSSCYITKGINKDKKRTEKEASIDCKRLSRETGNPWRISGAFKEDDTKIFYVCHFINSS
jgi:hypothetical protein